ncbi:class I SAM-dependent methyltransferase [Dactylosporangium aurantiacum]|uniref:Class I SAM-dependent methyltransferase n=1 Tax=Dactylosporangium aurantiacum TaxID=35754 RepID=A0A9Q9IJQ9_9ACTN|nr:class I SAM-dependent methyltransferase [Dactylosporangium aurantiacum]MDG6104101.1 class I SAM-dependent methyltransferase [Dactylosporangium aurantiacum]UWZ56886.1 class I SAM-dependent methyltransferase [Dactylosporangium aurantiacum]
MEPDEYIRGLAADSLRRGDAVGWWDTLYVAAGEGVTEVPWDRGGPHRLLASWPGIEVDGAGRRAVVVGCGLGGDAEFIASRGYATVAFDVSPAAVRTARSRFPDSGVDYTVADLFDVPAAWRGGFDLVLESMTVQALPRDLRDRAVAAVRDLVAPGGTLLVIAAATREGQERVEGPPWPLTRADVAGFETADLRLEALDELEEPEFHRWRATLRRAPR